MTIIKYNSSMKNTLDYCKKAKIMTPKALSDSAIKFKIGQYM